jgi:RHS repeat-associated protein
MFGPGADQPILWDEGSTLNCSGTHVYQADERGSIIASADCSGNLTHVYRYDEYGIPQSWDGSALIAANGARFGYTGQVWLPELGLYYYKARMYSPTLGRFMQTDPIGYGDGLNIYRYAHNDPVNGTDPTGLFDWGELFDCLGQICVTGHLPPEPYSCEMFNGCYSYEGYCSMFGCGSSGTNLTPPSSSGGTPPASQQQPTQPQKPTLPCNSKTSLGLFAEKLDKLSEYSSDAALGSGVAALATSETIVGGVTFAGAATVLEGVSFASSFAATTLKGLDGNRRGAIAGTVSLLVGFAVPKGLQKLALANGGFAGEVGKKFNEFAAKALGSATERGTEAAICHL